MHQSAETGFATVGDAKLAGFSGKTDYGKDAQAAFENMQPIYQLKIKVCKHLSRHF